MKAIHECSTVQLIRSATIKVSLGGTTFLIDRCWLRRGLSGFPESMNMSQRNPMVELPFRLRKC